MTDETHDLTLTILKKMQVDLANLQKLPVEVHDLQVLVRDGFSSLKSHIVAAHSDQIMLENRILNLENEVMALKRRFGSGIDA